MKKIISFLCILFILNDIIIFHDDEGHHYRGLQDNDLITIYREDGKYYHGIILEDEQRNNFDFYDLDREDYNNETTSY